MTGQPPITLLAIGSRGDVEPMAILAGSLAASGHHATVVAVDDYADLVRANGAAFRGIGPGMAEVTRLGRSWIGALAFRTPAAQPMLLRRWLSGLADPLAEALDEVPSGSCVVTGLASRAAALSLVQDRGCSMATLLHTAVLPTLQASSHLEGTRLTGWEAADRRFVDWYWRTVSGLSQACAAHFRELRGLPTLSDAQVFAQADAHPIVLAADPVLIPPAPDWPTQTRQSGAIRPALAHSEPSEPLSDFLAAGESPVFVTLGSLNDSGGLRWLELIVAAARLSGRRVVTPALPGRDPEVLDTRVCTVGPVPHDVVFAQMAGVVHHAGAGTTAAALRAGVASVAVPAVFDQTYHGRRLAELGVGPSPVPLPKLTASRLAGLIEAVAGTDFVDRAAEVGRRARHLDGTAATRAALAPVLTGDG